MLIFDATLYTGKPSNPLPGLHPLSVVYASELWETADRTRVPHQHKVELIAKRCSGKLTCVDVEHWPTGRAWVVLSKEQVTANLEKMSRLMGHFHKTNPALRVGYYDLLEGLGGNMKAQLSVIEEDDRRVLAPIASGSGHYMLEGLANKVDILMPSFYVRYENDVKSNQIRCNKRLFRLRPFHKQTYPFIWMQFHDASKWKGQWLPPDLLGALLSICKNQADGCILWSGSSPWTDVPPDLWQIVQNFVDA